MTGFLMADYYDWYLGQIDHTGRNDCLYSGLPAGLFLYLELLLRFQK